MRLVSRLPDSMYSVESLPFTPGDVTAGTENELQAVVVGKRTNVDLPITIERSKYYANILRRVAAGEASSELLDELRRFLEQNEAQVWDNSWVRFPRKHLSPYASQQLDQDLRLNAHALKSPRSDRDNFVFATKWGEWVRIPISYLVKLALADLIGKQAVAPSYIKETALKLMPHFSNDLTSPETLSFYVVQTRNQQKLGPAVAREMSIRFLFTHLLVEWANKNWDLETTGQYACVNFAPQPGVRQRELNNCVSDAFYRELFVSPCLSGWTDGEAKHEYMLMAHQITSRSQINAVVKLRESGIVTNNLVVLPNTSSVSLANNGTHLTLGSRKLTNSIGDSRSQFTAADGKWFGDLVIKICEHFLPLFVGTYTAAPYRLGFSDFHPERALGFLPHEIDYTHLRMIWRHWKRKAHLRAFGRARTPYGPGWLDRNLVRLFRIRGDFVPDYRLIDFPVAWLCTESVSALDGQRGNTIRLKRDLENMGVSDRKLKLYLPIGLREVEDLGFFGFEGRHYSLFETMSDDFAPAADLQQLITVLAYKYAFSGQYTHADLPDDPFSESERRLPFFCAALGLPAFNLRHKSPNLLMQRLATFTEAASSSRHKGYARLNLRNYQRALIRLIEEDGSDCVALLGLNATLQDLRARIDNPSLTAHGKLVRGITSKLNTDDPLKLDAREFNLASEQFYRIDLKRKHLKESFDFVRRSLKRQPRERLASLKWILGELDPIHFLNEVEACVVENELKPVQLSAALNLMLVVIRWNSDEQNQDPKTGEPILNEPPVHQSTYATGV